MILLLRANNTKRLQEKTTGGALNTVNEVAQKVYGQ